MMPKPQQILDLEKHLGFSLTETQNPDDIWNKSKTYLLNAQGEVIGLNLRDCRISDISFLQGLTHLISLNLSINQISDISFLQGLTNLTELKLSGNKISDISFLQGLTNLTRLNLWNNQISDISFLQGLTHLTELNLERNQISDISFLQGLTHLTRLDLEYNQISDISFLQGLTHLTRLDLERNQISDISFLQGLTNLTSLDLSGNKISNISFLQGLTNLTELNLYNNQISDISFLQGLTNLTSLNLSGNKISNISFLQGLTNLTSLYLYDNQISDTSALRDLTNLTSLFLGNNQISDISFLQGLTHLTELNLHYNKISDISALQGLTHLTSLNLSVNQISDISLSFLNRFPELKELRLLGNPIQNIPKEIFYKYGNVLQDVRNYLESLEQDGAIPNDQIKMLLLGNSTAGKTSLIEFLRKGTYEKNRVSTHGIEIDSLIWKPFETDKTASETEKNIKVSVWDFGGQEFYHNTHSLFFSENAIYLVLFEAATNFQGKKLTKIYLYEDGEKKGKEVDLEHFEYSYWLENVQYLNQGKQGVTLLVQNKCDENEAVSIEDSCKQRYQLKPEKDRIFYISVEGAFHKQEDFLDDFNAFKRKLLKYIKENIAKFDNSKKWQEIKNKIQEEWKKDNVLDYTEYVERCKKIKPTIDDRKEGQTESQLDTLTRILREQGIVLQYKHIPELKDKIFVNPAWLTDCIYKVLDYSVIKNEGKFDQAHLEKIAQTLPNISAGALLALLKNFNLIFEIVQDGEKWFICPQYLPETFTDKRDIRSVKSLVSTTLPKHCFTLSYPKFLPVSTFLKWMAMHGKDQVECWYNKNELLFVENNKVAYAKCVRTKDERSITIQIQDRDASTAKQLFEELLSIDFPSDLQVSVNEGKNFVEVKELQNAHRQNSKTVKDINSNYLEIKDFWFLFGKESSNPNPPTTMDYKIRIKNALAALEGSHATVYFTEMSAVMEEYDSIIAFEDKNLFSGYKFEHKEKGINLDFSRRLRHFAIDLKDYLDKKLLEEKLTQTLNTLPATTKEEIAKQVSEVKEVKENTQSSKAKQIFNTVMEKLAMAGISIVSTWAMNFVLQSLGIDKEAITTFMEIFKAFSDNKE